MGYPVNKYNKDASFKVINICVIPLAMFRHYVALLSRFVT